jgi:hypothetical protein
MSIFFALFSICEIYYTLSEEFALMAEVMRDVYSQFFDCIHGGIGGRKAVR